jgi:hypothetical protein
MHRTDVMVDIETLGTAPGCKVLTVGAVAFDATRPFPASVRVEHGLSLAIDRASSGEFGLLEDRRTLEGFWDRQSADVRAAAFDAPDRLELPVALAVISDWFGGLAEDADRIRVWCHGASFDVPILSAAYDACGMAAPWDFRMLRDTRTVYDLGGVVPDRTSGAHHEALNDALVQARAVCLAYEKLGLSARFPAAA